MVNVRYTNFTARRRYAVAVYAMVFSHYVRPSFRLSTPTMFYRRHQCKRRRITTKAIWFFHAKDFFVELQWSLPNRMPNMHVWEKFATFDK